MNEYIIPNWNTPELVNKNYNSGFELLFGYTSLYYLFILCGIAVMIFAIVHYKKIELKGTYIANLVLGSLCVLWPLLLIAEKGVGNISFETNGDSRAIVSLVTVLLLYFSMPFLGAAIIGNTLYHKKYDTNSTVFSLMVIISFAVICLLFGVKVGYSDYTSGSKPKMIICFLTMVVFVACLLIWKPYISIVMLAGIFVAFLFMLKGYNPDNIPGKRIWLEGDEINYLTFLVSLTMVTISIYQQRITEAKKDEKLIHDAVYDHQIEIHNVKYLIGRITTDTILNPNYIDDKIYLFINIFNFRAVNDQKGIAAGDAFLNRISKYVISLFGHNYSARHADDHFAAITSINGLKEKIEELDKYINEIADGLFIRLKVGGYKPKYDDNPTLCIDRARYACGMIKRKSEVTYFEYDEALNQRFVKRQYIVNHLEEAIEKGWIQAYYQPVVWADSKEVCGSEALARWIDPKYGFLSPGDFIPVLEETRLIHKLDKCIIEYVCKQMRKAIDEGRKVIPVSVNFSRLDFELMDAVGVLEGFVQKYDIKREYIHVEITESALSDETLMLDKNVTKLKELGYAIWLDDFGSGYSSLNVLKDYMFDVVKIDMKFLSNFDTNEKAKYVLDFIIQLANQLGMKTLTEGVETEAQSQFLEEIGCGRLQGYLFGKPIKVEELEERIANKELVISDNLI